MMAANLSDDGSAPVDFNLSSTIDDGEVKNGDSREKCFLCDNLRKTFYCKVCVANGDFVSSTPQNPERYADKKLLWLKLRSEKQALSNKCMKMFEKMEIRTRLQSEINQCRGRIKLLLQLNKRKNEFIKKTDKEIEIIKEKNLSRTSRLPRNKERIEKLEHYVANNMKTEIKQRKNRVAKAELELRKIVQKNVEDLICYIFPMSKVDAISKSAEELESTDTVTALAEATRTSYVRGKWVFMDSSGDLHYRIVAPTLPGSGDYSAYSDWVAANKNVVPGNEKMTENQAYNISAALCYTTQLVNLLAFYLDVLLPNRLSYVDFYNTDISDNKFNKKISKLNTNILYLCFSQGVDTSLLNPKHTLNNLLHLVNYSDLGKTQPFEIDSNLVFSLENYESDAKGDDCSDDEENDVPSEWEAIPLVPCPESNPGCTPFPTLQTPSMQSTTSMAGGLVTSLASMWRGWTGGNRKKSSKKPFESRETVLQEFSEASNSSSATASDLDEFVLQEVGSSRFTKEMEFKESAPTFTPAYNLRNRRRITKRCRESPPKRSKSETKTKKIEEPFTIIPENDSEKVDSCKNSKRRPPSQESISLLQDCYDDDESNRNDFPELLETCINSQIEMININSDEEMEGTICRQFSQEISCDEYSSSSAAIEKVNNSSQTDFSIFPSEISSSREDENATNRAKLIRSIINLKRIISSKREISAEKLCAVLKEVSADRKIFYSSGSPEENSLHFYFSPSQIDPVTTVSGEDARYLVRFGNFEDGIVESVNALLDYFEKALENNLDRIAFLWKNSIYELAAGMLNEEVICGKPEIRKMVGSFLARIITSVLKNESQIKNLSQETKSTFVVTFCQSSHYCQDAISSIIENLNQLKEMKQGENCFLSTRIQSIRSAKNSYFLIRALQKLLEEYKRKFAREKIETVSGYREKQNFNVLEMWKKNWRRNEEEIMGEEKMRRRCKSKACKWSESLDEVLLHCVLHLPVLANSVEKCATLAKDILKIDHSEIMEIE